MSRHKLFCCICGQPIYKEGCPNYLGNNPRGAICKNMLNEIIELNFNPSDRCCDDCYNKFVIPGRLYHYFKSKVGK